MSFFHSKYFLVAASMIILVLLMFYSQFVFSKKMPVNIYKKNNKPGSYATLSYAKVKSTYDIKYNVDVLGEKFILVIKNTENIKVGEYITIEGYYNDRKEIECFFVHNHGNYIFFSIISFIIMFYIFVFFFMNYRFNFKKGYFE